MQNFVSLFCVLYSKAFAYLPERVSCLEERVRGVTPYNGAKNLLLYRGIYFRSLESFVVIFGENKLLSEFHMPSFPS
jgi:hypothetical protein